MEGQHFPAFGFDKSLFSEKMQDSKLDGIILSSPNLVYYVTGYPVIPGTGNPILFALRNQYIPFAYVDSSGSVTFLTWIGAIGDVSFGAEDMRVCFNQSSALEEITNIIREKIKDGMSIGVESQCPKYILDRAHDLNLNSLQISDCDRLLNEIVSIKSEAEINCIKKATRICEETMLELEPILKVGMTRKELIREAKTRLLANGADAVSHATIGFGATNHEIALDEVLEANQLIQIDLGASVSGYVSDIRRIYFSSPLTSEITSAFEKICGIIDGAADLMKPGVKFADIFERVNELFAQTDLMPFFITPGHTMGLQTEELWIVPENDYEIRKNMIVNLEVYTQHLSGALIGDEETYLITENGPQRITQLPRLIKSICN